MPEMCGALESFVLESSAMFEGWATRAAPLGEDGRLDGRPWGVAEGVMGTLMVSMGDDHEFAVVAQRSRGIIFGLEYNGGRGERIDVSPLKALFQSTLRRSCPKAEVAP